MKKWIFTILVALLVIISIINVVCLCLETSDTGFEFKSSGIIFFPFILSEIILLVKVMKRNSKILYCILFILALIVIIISGIIIKSERNFNIVKPMSNYALAQFNIKFTTYEGNITGSQVKNLVKIVNDSNMEFEDIKVSINNKKYITQYSVVVENNKKYKVECEKLDGAVCNINIYYEDKLIEVSEKQ